MFIYKAKAKRLEWLSLSSSIFLLVPPFSKFSSVSMYTSIIKKNQMIFLNGFAGTKLKCIDKYSWVTWRKVSVFYSDFFRVTQARLSWEWSPEAKGNHQYWRCYPDFVNNLLRAWKKVSREGDEECSFVSLAD